MVPLVYCCNNQKRANDIDKVACSYLPARTQVHQYERHHGMAAREHVALRPGHGNSIRNTERDRFTDIHKPPQVWREEYTREILVQPGEIVECKSGTDGRKKEI